MESEFKITDNEWACFFYVLFKCIGEKNEEVMTTLRPVWELFFKNDHGTEAMRYLRTALDANRW